MPTEFTPYASLGGGILIGIASVLLMASIGRIMGATGVLAGFFAPSSKEDWAWRASLLAGMVTAPALILLTTGTPAEIQVPVSTTAMVIGGLIVGAGVTYGGGCTSGHGVCGMARLSPRSIVATATFMAFAGLTVYVARHVFTGGL